MFPCQHDPKRGESKPLSTSLLHAQPVFAAAARVAIDLKLFHLIADSSSGITVARLAEASGCSETLLVRLLRPLAALHFVHEVDESMWSATPITRAMCIPPIEAAHIHL